MLHYSSNLPVQLLPLLALSPSHTVGLRRTANVRHEASRLPWYRRVRIGRGHLSRMHT